MFSRSPNVMDILPILSDNGKYPEMEIGLFQTESSYNYRAEWVFCEIPMLEPMFSRSPNVMDILPIVADNGKNPEMEIDLYQTGSSFRLVIIVGQCRRYVYCTRRPRKHGYLRWNFADNPLHCIVITTSLLGMSISISG